MRDGARRIAAAQSVAIFEDLGVQMNRHSTLVSYLHKLLDPAHRQLRQEGRRLPAELPWFRWPAAATEGRRTPVTGSRIIGGLTPCNVIPEEILTDHPKRFRAMLVESAQSRALARRRPRACARRSRRSSWWS